MKKKQTDPFLVMRKPEFKDSDDRSSVDLSKDVSDKTAEHALKHEKESVRMRYALATGGIFAGIILTVLGATGVVDLGFSLFGASAQLTNASPGLAIIVLSLVGGFVTKPNIKVK